MALTEPWAPTLADVARHIPTRTRDTRSPGSDKQLGTFSPWTTPDDGQAQACIDAAVHTVLTRTEGLVPPADDTLTAMARTAAEWRAAADIEIAYPGRDADIRLYAMLDQRAKDAINDLREALGLAGTGPGGAVTGPVGSVIWRAPGPPPWADRDPSERPLRPYRDTTPPGVPPYPYPYEHPQPGGG